MTRDLEHILTEFDDDGEGSKKKKEPTVESIIDSAFDDDLQTPGEDKAVSPPLESTDGEPIQEPLVEPAAEPVEQEATTPPVTDETPAAPAVTSDSESIIVDTLPQELPGTRSWNTRPPYLIAIDRAELDNNIASLDKSFFVTEGNLPQDELSDHLKRALLRYLKKQQSSSAETFRQIVNRVILRESENIVSYFSLPGGREKIFIYHLGIATMDAVLQYRLKKEGIGYCYIYGTDGKAQRFFPAVFLKQVVFDWYQNNIHPLDLPFDSLEIFDSLKTVISKKYMDVEREFRTRLEKINMKVDPSRRITADKLIQIKGDEWYDQAVIITYRRFLGRTIFG